MAAAGLIAAAALIPANAADISGAGATFPYPIYAKWAGVAQSHHSRTQSAGGSGDQGGQ
jgi:phosphate transport system substrate-binding protein